VILFAIQLIAGVAIGHWQRRRDEPSTRMLVMGVGLLFMRIILMLVALLDSVGLVSSMAVLPPLERFLQIMSYFLVVWASLPVVEEYPSLGTTFLLVSTVFAAGAYAASALLWPEAQVEAVGYVGHWQERAWEWSSAAFLALALVTNLVSQAPDWGWLVCLVALWLLGHILQLVTPTSDVNAAGWVRLANLVAMPLLAAIVYRRALEPAAAAPLRVDESDSGALGILEAVRRIKSDGDPGPSLDLAVASIARTVDADVVVIGLLAPGPVEVMRVVAFHPTGAAAGRREPTLLLSNHPMLATAYRGRRQERVTGGHGDVSPVDGLYRRLGFDGAGPLLVQPLTVGDDVVGLLLVGNPESQREWTADDEQIVEAIGFALACAIARDEARAVTSGT
jgi:hypothetical protein